ncbi:hypothetical protein GC102_17270 [Paenibacillus sp. LMG 31460]|uniref:Uncharacterized protein n=1 Tax=Paenibacillus germinis TaxID=2654979 RepID=A0ABX1Z2X1_9BACL|nr:hypothetical protein [Paenibacillus germinis]NOU87522.1 hypothetical protein [Paenibacillus germinis]
MSLGPEADSSYFINFTVHLFHQFWNKLEKIELKGIEVAARQYKEAKFSMKPYLADKIQLIQAFFLSSGD